MIKSYKKFLESLDLDIMEKIEYFLYPQLDNIDGEWKIKECVDIHPDLKSYKIGFLIETNKPNLLKDIDISVLEKYYTCELGKYILTISDVEVIESEDYIYELITGGDKEKIKSIKEIVNPIMDFLIKRPGAWVIQNWSGNYDWIFIKDQWGLLCSQERWYNKLLNESLNFQEISVLTKFLFERKFGPKNQIVVSNIRY